ncbi:helix-turn-helix domain-containing protein, partial [Bacillus velezensis]|uniref:helix-turn-helix domain-containing protein n=2 Tax=Bacillati TaxID=1783272 RepID=UPI0035DAC7D3
MSLLPILWALKTAPVIDAEERAILVTLAESAWSDGTDAFPSKKTIADIAKIDPKTVQRRLKTLVTRGLIARGNQAAAAYIPEHFRPTVYDLMIPYSWFPDIVQVNEERRGKGKPPLTPFDRPDLSEAPPRKQRADKGKPRKKRQDGVGSTSPQGEDSESPGQTGQGVGSTSPGGGDYKSQRGGLQDPQPSPTNP